MALKGKQWPLPTSSDPESLIHWAQELIRNFQKGWHREFALGTVTLTAGTTTILNDKALLATSKIFFTALNPAAGALGIPRPTSKANASWTLTHNNAAGTEQYDYVILSIPAA